MIEFTQMSTINNSHHIDTKHLIDAIAHTPALEKVSILAATAKLAAQENDVEIRITIESEDRIISDTTYP